MSRDELKLCPFCGERQGMHKEQGMYALNATSHKRRCIMRKLLSFYDVPAILFNTPADAVNAWNMRDGERHEQD